MTLPTPSPDHTALVTGASSGIGEAIARQLAQRGHGLTLVARRTDELERVASELRSPQVRVEVVPCDLGDRDARAALVDTMSAFGLSVDILINNAGFSTLGPVAQADPDQERSLVEVDVLAVVDLCVRFLPSMVEHGRGAILNVASTAAFQPLPGQASYGGAKAFVLSYTEALHAELAGTGVTATVLCPGPVDTGFGERAGFSKEDAESSLPKIMWESAEKVASVGIEAMAAGRPVAIPGTANRVGAVIGRLAPNRLLVPLMAKNHPGLRSS